MGVITFNGKSSTTIGLVVETPPDYEMPERIYEITPVPGRSGDIVFDTGAYRNVDREYKVAIGAEGANFASLAHDISTWLHSGSGYLRLEDSYTPEYFMMAMYAENSSITNLLQQAGQATLRFNRKPQRFLKTGETAINITSTTTITNPTAYISNPLIRVNGNGVGTITVGDRTVQINKNTTYIMIDSEIEEAHSENLNMNMYVLTPNGFPVLKPGPNRISFTGAITSITIIPRWWTL